MKSATSSSPFAVFVYCALLLLAAGLQAQVSHRLHFCGGQPDFLFALLLTTAFLSDSSGTGALIGFGGGLMTGAVVWETVGTFLVSRTLAGFVAGWFSDRMSQSNVAVLIFAVAGASVVGELVYVLAAPRIGLSRWVLGALVGTAWNIALSLPLFFLLRRLGWGRCETIF